MIQKKLYSTYKELQNDAINNCFAVYGDLDEYNNKFESIIFPEQNYICGLAYYNHGIDSQMLLLDNESNLLIGFEKRIIGIDYNNKKEIFENKSISLFYEFIKTECCILAICELDIFAYNFKCQPIWSFNFRDTIEDYNVINGKKVSIFCSNGDNLILALENGTVLK